LPPQAASTAQAAAAAAAAAAAVAVAVASRRNLHERLQNSEEITLLIRRKNILSQLKRISLVITNVLRLTLLLAKMREKTAAPRQ
jgi:hypothetical protein